MAPPRSPDIIREAPVVSEDSAGVDGAPTGAPRNRGASIGGDPNSGKSWKAGLLCEQLILQRYSVCVLGPEVITRAWRLLPV